MKKEKKTFPIKKDIEKHNFEKCLKLALYQFSGKSEFFLAMSAILAILDNNKKSKSKKGTVQKHFKVTSRSPWAVWSREGYSVHVCCLLHAWFGFHAGRSGPLRCTAPETLSVLKNQLSGP